MNRDGMNTEKTARGSTDDAPGRPVEAGSAAVAGSALPHGRQVLYVATEDWFFRSHFLPMARAATRAGYEVSLAARLGAAAPVIAAEGIRLIPLEMKRGTLNPVHVVREVLRLRRLLRQEEPDILHLVALKSILVGGVASLLAPVPSVVNSVTGVGFLGIRGSLKMALVRPVLWPVMRALLGRANSWVLVENKEDARMLGRDRIIQVGGSGVDPDDFAELPAPDRPVVNAAVVARMLWSKGIDTTVEAHRLLRRRGIDINLTLAGPVDRETPNALSEETLREWSREAGIQWIGPQTDVRRVWRDADIAVLASRGGEGLPRALLEAAACGRPVITTDVPGCRDFVRSGVEGFVVPPDDPRSLADALEKLAVDAVLRKRMGAAARARILADYTEKQIAETVVGLYDAISRRPRDPGFPHPSRSGRRQANEPA